MVWNLLVRYHSSPNFHLNIRRQGIYIQDDILIEILNIDGVMIRSGSNDFFKVTTKIFVIEFLNGEFTD